METQSNQLDFSGQVFYVGLDVHKKNWLVCIRSNHKVFLGQYTRFENLAHDDYGGQFE